MNASKTILKNHKLIYKNTPFRRGVFFLYISLFISACSFTVRDMQSYKSYNCSKKNREFHGSDGSVIYRGKTAAEL